MTASTSMSDRPAGRDGPDAPTPHRLRWPLVLTATVFWLVVWQIVASAVGQEIIVASPLRVAQVLVRLVATPSFWATAWRTAWHIAAGFALAVVAGTILAWLASLHRWASALLSPPIRAMRAVPVVSFIILLLIWGGSGTLALTVACLMVLPVVFDSISEGLRRVPGELLEMARVFRVRPRRAIRAIIAPAVWPYLIAGARIGVGLAWKSGVSAEVIGLPGGTIGARLFEAKLYLATGDLFAWTVVIVTLGLGTERLVLWLLGRAEHAFEGLYRDRVVGVGLQPVQHSQAPSSTHDLGGHHSLTGVYGVAGLPVDDLPGELRLVHISKAYGGCPVLEHVSLTVPDGGVLRLTGPNGIGKSTLLKIIMGLVAPDSGRVTGVPAGVAAVFQEDRLCPWLSAIGNLRLIAPTCRRADAEAVLSDFGLPGEAVARPVRELSGGQRRRVAIARAVLAKADLVCLDEPFTGIDADSIDDVIHQLKGCLAGKTVLYVTHDDAQAASLPGGTFALG